MLKFVCLFGLVAAIAAQSDCDYDGTIYKTGASFVASDGCNRCFCSNGNVACTLMFCMPASTCKYGNTTHQNGDSFKSLDGCNSCGCHNGNIICTERACLSVDPIIPI